MISWSKRYLNSLIITSAKAVEERFLFVLEKSKHHKVFTTIESTTTRKLLNLVIKARLKGLDYSSISQIVTQAGAAYRAAWEEAEAQVASEPPSERAICETLEEQLRRYLTTSMLAEVVDLAKEEAELETEDLQSLINQYYLDVNFSYDFREIVVDENLDSDVIAKRYQHTRRVPFVVKQLNEIMRGGAGLGELWLIIGGQNAGKSHALVATACEAALNGETVVVFTLEMNAASYEERILSNLSGVPIVLIQQQLDKATKTVQNLLKKSGGAIYIKEYPTGTATVTHFRNYFARLRAKGLVPSVACIDYADLMRPPGYGRDLKDYQSLGVLYRELRRFCQEESVAGWTASQLNRGGVTKNEEADETDIAGAFEKLPIVDGAFVLRSTKDEKNINRARFLLAKNRTNAKVKNGKIVEVAVEMQTETMRIEGLGFV